MLTSTEVSLAQAQRQKFISEEVCFGDDLSEGVCAESRHGGKVTDSTLMSTLLTGCLVLSPLGTQPKWSTGEENRFPFQVQIFTGRKLYPGSLNPSFIKGQLPSFVPGSLQPNTVAAA